MTTSAPKFKDIYKHAWKGFKRLFNEQVSQRWVNRFFQQKSLLFVGWGTVNIKGSLLRKSPRMETFWLDLNSDKLLTRASVFSSVVGWVLGCRSEDGEMTLPDVFPAKLIFPTQLSEPDDHSVSVTGGEEGFNSLLENEDSSGFSWKVFRLGSCVSWVPEIYRHNGMSGQRVLVIYKEEQVFVLPVFELARVLFLNKAYLAREAFNPTVLPDLCVHSRKPIDKTDQEQCVIECSKSVPKGLFSSEEAGLLEKITQILLVPTLRSSYGSIFTKMVKESNDGFFNFQLPDLSEVELDLNVLEVQENVFFVTEILGLDNLPSFFGEVTVDFPFAKKKEDKPVATTGGKIPGVDSDGDAGADDSGDSNPGMSKKIGHVRLRRVSTGYRHRTKVRKLSRKEEKSIRKQRMLNPEFENVELIGGFTEEEWGGKLAQMEFDSIYSPMESDFVKQIKSIAKNNGLDCLYEVYKVPNSGNGRYHLVNAMTGERRKAMCFSFKPLSQENYDRFLIELERLDGESISTLIIYASPQNRKMFFKELLALCDLRKGHWSGDIFIFLQSKRPGNKIIGHQKVKHKKIKSGSGLTQDDLDWNTQKAKDWFLHLESKIAKIQIYK